MVSPDQTPLAPINWHNAPLGNVPEIDLSGLDPAIAQAMPLVARALCDVTAEAHERLLADQATRARLAERIPDNDQLDQRFQGLADGLALSREAWDRFILVLSRAVAGDDQA